MTTAVDCPGCGHQTEIDGRARNADGYCPSCDYPLFWIPEVSRTAVVHDVDDDSRRRLPGAGGRKELGVVRCPSCGEHQPLRATTCTRCRGPMVQRDPGSPSGVAAPPPPIPPPPPPPPQLAIAPPPANTWVWLVVATTVVSVAATALLVV